VRPLLPRVGPPGVSIGSRIPVNASVLRVSPQRVSVGIGSCVPSGVSVPPRVTPRVRVNITPGVRVGVSPPRVRTNIAPGVRVRVSPPAAFHIYVGIQGVRLVEVLLGVRPEVLRLRLPPLGLLAEPCRLNLGLLGISFGTHGLGFIFAGLKFRFLSLAADFGRVLAVLFVALLPERFPAPAVHEQSNQRDDDDYNDDPNPGSCIHRGSTSLHIQHGPAICAPRCSPDRATD
jgi:hypothetical protein